MKKIVKAKGLEYLYNKKELCTIILRDEYAGGLVTFFTDDRSPQQIGYLPHAKGGIIKPHVHKPLKRVIHTTSETLFIKSGKVKINLYSVEKEFIGSDILKKGDLILLCSGGHGFEILEDTIIVEVKQGPYLGINDKETFSGVEK